MDILVRIPKKQMKHFVEDKMTSDIAFWTFHNKPKHLNSGDYIFFTTPEGVRYAGQITKIVSGDKLVEEVGLGFIGQPGNFNALLEGLQIRDMGPIASINYAQQSYRYCTEDEQKELRRRLQNLG